MVEKINLSKNYLLLEGEDINLVGWINSLDEAEKVGVILGSATLGAVVITAILAFFNYLRQNRQT